PDDARVFMQTSSAVAADDDGKKDSRSKEETEDAEKKEPCPECPECPDPAKVVLRGLEEKRTMVEKQLMLLEQGRKELAVFEEQLDEKIENFNALKKQVAEDMAALTKIKTQKELDKEAEYEAKIGRLVKMYAGMKPKNAAQIVDKMNLEVAQEIFLRMREASASQILAFVESEKAAKISERLAFKRK
ncbi:MAG: hypothetical protein KJ760_16140, partial [Proteobacteria bacterium]|nr:hypothetical protein [Pseudomonadota bacterium]